MPAEDFLDTNVFVYQLDTSDPRKSARADALVRRALVNGSGCISYQVVQEWLNVVTGKARLSLPPDEAALYLDAVLMPLWRVGASVELYRRALDLRERWRFGFYDSLIVASALAAGCTRLLTEDLQHGQRIESLTIVDPFRD
jgi:predicted nucleic acid-binding protein